MGCGSILVFLVDPFRVYSVTGSRVYFSGKTIFRSSLGQQYGGSYVLVGPLLCTGSGVGDEREAIDWAIECITPTALSAQESTTVNTQPAQDQRH